MPIRINLLAEAVAAEDLRRRDPVKRAIYAGAFVVVLSLVWFSAVWLESVRVKIGFNRVEDEIQQHTNDYAQVQSNLKKITDVQTKMDALDKLTGARFLQGNLMNALQQTYVQNVQLNRLRVDQSYRASAAVAPVTNSYGVVPGRPPAITEHIVLTMDAKDFSSNPGDQVPHYKDALLKQDYFSHSLDSTNGAHLTGLSALQSPGDSRPYVMFTLECHFLDRTP